MKLEQQVVSLELAKRMKGLGFTQESYFKYCGGHTMYENSDEGDFEPCENTDLLESDEYCHTAGLTCEFTISAYTVAELGEMLPVTIQVGEDIFFYVTNKTIYNHRCGYEYKDPTSGWGRINDSEHHSVGEGKTEADARAKMLIYLKENNLL